MMAAFTRMTDKAVFSKSSDLRLHASIGIGRLAYIDPERTLPSVMSRFEEALSHETATRQLVPAMNCLALHPTDDATSLEHRIPRRERSIRQWQ